jgi:hypothetical protein
MTSAKKKPATGRVELSPEGFEYAGFYSLKQTEMGHIFGVDQSVISERLKLPEFREAYDRGRVNARTEPIKMLYASARKGSVRAQIFLAQAVSGLSEKLALSVEGSIQQRYVVELPVETPLQQWQQAFGPPDDPNVIDVQPTPVKVG